MKRPQEIAANEAAMGTIVNLTSVFETLASMRISQIKNQVQNSQAFFAEIWQVYTQLQVGSKFQFGRQQGDHVIDKDLYIAITAEGGFSGDIDQKLIKYMLEGHDPAKQDIIIVGHHGALQLTQAGVSFKKYFKLPIKDENINVTPLLAQVQQYRNTAVFYQTYVSLMVQDIKKIELNKAVQDAGMQTAASKDVISEATYIFEPSTAAVAAHLERSMIQIALSQTILESKLAQYASRFRAMSTSKQRSTDSARDLHLLYNRTKRSMADERLKEIINGMRRIQTI